MTSRSSERTEGYLAATPEELHSRSSTWTRAGGLADQALLFPHSGTLTLDEDTLRLSGFRNLRPHDIESVEQEFISEYGRIAAGGLRGGFPSLGFFKRQGAPLVLHLTTGERIVLLLGFERVLGVTKNREWLDALRVFAERD